MPYLVVVRALEDLVHPVNEVLLLGLELVGNFRAADRGQHPDNAEGCPSIAYVRGQYRTSN